MRKNLNKIVAFAIGISVMSGSIVPVMAAETKVTYIDPDTIDQNVQQNGKPILTVEDVADQAVKNSEAIKKLDNTIEFQEKNITLNRSMNSVNEKLEDNKEDAGTPLDDYQKDFNKTDRDYTNDSNELDLKIYKQQREFAKDGIKFDATKKYNDIIIKQMTIENEKKKLDVAQKKLDDTKLKNQLGLITSINRESSENEIQKSKDSIEKSTRELNDAKYELGKIIGKDLNEYVLEEQIKYNPLIVEDKDVDEYLQGIMDNYINLQKVEEVMHISDQYSKEFKDYIGDYKEKLDDYKEDLDSSKDKLDKQASEIKSYKDNVPQKTPEMTDEEYKNAVSQHDKDYKDQEDKYNENKINYYKSEAAYYQQKLGYYGYQLKNYANDLTNKNNELELESMKKSYMNTLRGYYTSLISMQNSIETFMKDVEISNKKLRNLKLQYDLGLVIKSDYDNAVLQNQDLQVALIQQINGCNQYRDMIEKPWISISTIKGISNINSSGK